MTGRHQSGGRGAKVGLGLPKLIPEAGLDRVRGQLGPERGFGGQQRFDGSHRASELVLDTASGLDRLPDTLRRSLEAVAQRRIIEDDIDIDLRLVAAADH